MSLTLKLTYEQVMLHRNSIQKGYFDSYDDDPQAWRHSFAGAYLWKLPKRTFVMDIMKDMLGHTPTWDDITDLFLIDFKERMLSRYVSNSCRVIFNEIKALLNDYQNITPVPSLRYGKILNARKEPSQAVYLTPDELYQIHTYAPLTDIEREVKRVFMIEAITGARHEDARALRISNLDMRSHTLSYVAEKTKKEVSLPIHRWLRRYLAEADTCPFTRELYVATVNDTIRTICQRVRIATETTLFRRGKNTCGPKYQFVTTHTGRRSFATNLFLLGTDPFTIARFMGHANPNTTIENYIIGYRPVPEEADRFFNYSPVTTIDE